MIKRVVGVILIICMMLVLAACDRSEHEDPQVEDGMKVVWVPRYNPSTHTTTMQPMIIPE